MTETSTNFHDFNILALNEIDTIRMADFKGKKILVVNVASKCGYTPQYTGLQKLYEIYNDSLVVIGFPCNQFLGQEPGTNQEIDSFCKNNYNITFPLTTKIEVKGSNQHPIYNWLTSEELNGVESNKIGWNFTKFLIDENGHFVAHYSTKTKPFDKEIIDAIEK
jgi:glutathione peroxidase